MEIKIKVPTHKKKKKPVIKPNPALYMMAAAGSRLKLLQKGGVTVIKDEGVDLDRPFVMLCNHISDIDHMAAILGVYPARVNFVVSSYFFGKLLMASGLRLLGAIPKLQFQPDVMAVKKMLSVVRNEGAVAIYPEGQVGIDGITGYIHPAIAKLVKALDTDVILGMIGGSYMVKPKWAKYQRKGPIEFRTRMLLSRQELHTLTEEQVYEQICEALRHDDPTWAQQKGYTYKSPALAEGLESVLYLCPKCREEFTIKTAGDRFFCESCGNSGLMDAQNRLLPETKQSVVFSTVAQWKLWQKELLAERLKDDNFELVSQVSLEMPKDIKSPYEVVGSGALSADKECITYIGTLRDEDVELHFPWKLLTALPFVCGVNFEVPFHKTIYCFAPKIGPEVERWVELCELMRDNRPDNPDSIGAGL